eukprot:956914_1
MHINQSIFCKYFVIFFVSGSVYAQNNSLTVSIGILGPATSQIIGGFYLAIHEVNVNSKHQITPILSDSKGDPGIGFVQTLNFAGFRSSDDRTGSQSDVQKVPICLGPLFSSVAENAGLVARQFFLPLISPSATSLLLSDAERFPSFSRTVPSDELQGKALARLVQHFNISGVSILAGSGSYSSQLTDAFVAAARDLNISILQVQSLIKGQTDISVQARVIRESRSAVVAMIQTQKEVIVSLREFSRLGMRPPDYTFIGVDGWIDTALPEDIEPLARGAVGTTSFVETENEMYQKFLTSWRKARTSTPGFEVNQTFFQDLFQADPITYSAFAYDATNLAITALEILEEIKADCQRPRFTQQADIPSYVDCSDIMADRTGESLNNILRNVEFQGVTGKFQLTPNGDREADYAIVNRVSMGKVMFRGVVSDSNVNVTEDVMWPQGLNVVPDSLRPVACDNKQIAFTRDECNFDSHWNIRYNFREKCIGDVPLDDKIPCDHIPFRAFWAMVLVAAAGIAAVVTLSVMAVVLASQYHTVFVRSQPKLILCVGGGALISQAVVILSLGPPSNLQCLAVKILSVIGFDLSFGGLFFKAYRSYEVEMRRVIWNSTRQNWFRMSLILAVQVAIVSVWFGLQPPAISQGSFLTSGRLEVPVQLCRRSTGHVFEVLLGIFTFGWILTGCYLIGKARNVKYNFKESLWIGMACLVVVMSFLVYVPLVFDKTPNANNHAAALSIVLLEGTSVFFLLTFPRLILFWHPEKTIEGKDGVFESLDQILDNRICREHFRTFLQRKYAVENLEFMDDVDRFKLLALTKSAPDSAIRERADSIFYQCVATNSERQINLSDRMRKNIFLGLGDLGTSRPVSTLFDNGVLEVKRLLYDNHYFSFVRDNECLSAQRTLQWSQEFRKLRPALQTAVVRQFQYEMSAGYTRRDSDSFEGNELSVRSQSYL